MYSPLGKTSGFAETQRALEYLGGSDPCETVNFEVGLSMDLDQSLKCETIDLGVRTVINLEKLSKQVDLKYTSRCGIEVDLEVRSMGCRLVRKRELRFGLVLGLVLCWGRNMKRLVDLNVEVNSDVDSLWVRASLPLILRLTTLIHVSLR